MRYAGRHMRAVKDNNAYEQIAATWATCGLEGHLRVSGVPHVGK